jgi:hypothetical protein
MNSATALESVCPDVVTFRYSPDLEEYEGDLLEFRLIYEGRLPAESRSGTRGDVKHAIRKIIHGQLCELWERVSILRYRKNAKFMVVPENTKIYVPDNTPLGDGVTTETEALADKFARCGFRFVPLILKERSRGCSLDILFLRRDNPGDLIIHGGDIDNRIKTLLDALQMPQNCEQLSGQSPQEGENPFFCLLEDDALIAEIKITTDRLLKPQQTGETIHDVSLIIHVMTSR